MTGRWFYSRSGDERGPVLPLGLKAMADSGTLKPSDSVREEGTLDWIAAGRLSGLFARQVPGESPIPFLPETAPARPSEPMAPKPWQFSIRDMLAATALVAAACGIGSFIFSTRSLTVQMFEVSLAAIATLLGGAIGCVAQKPKKGFLYGCLTGVGLYAAMTNTLAVICVAVVYYIVHPKKPSHAVGINSKKPAPKEPIAVRQTRIYRISLVCSLSLLFLWLPIVFMVPRGAGCRPMFQAMWTMLFVLPATIVGICMAIRQCFAAENKWLAVRALVASVVPIVIFWLLQRLILDDCGIIYED